MAGELTIVTGAKERALVQYLATSTNQLRTEIEQKSGKLSSQERDLEIIKQKVAEIAVGAPINVKSVGIDQTTPGLAPLLSRYKDEVEAWIGTLPVEQQALFAEPTQP